HDSSSVKVYDGVTGAYLSDFVSAGSGGLNTPILMTFTETDPVTLAYTGDGVGEPREAIFVSQSVPSDATSTNGQGVGTMRVDGPRIRINDVSQMESKINNTPLFSFSVRLLIIAPGETAKTIALDVNGHSKKEADGTFYLDLFGNSSNSLFT